MIAGYGQEMDQKAESASEAPPDPGDPARRQPADATSPVVDGFAAVRAAYPPILNTSQVAELLDLNPRTGLNMAGDGRLPASRLPGSRKFHFLLEEIIEKSGSFASMSLHQIFY